MNSDIDSLVEDWLREVQLTSAASTHASRKDDIAHFLSWLDNHPKSFESLTYRDCRKYLQYMMTEEELDESTFTNRYAGVQLFYNYLEDKRIVEPNPFRRITLSDYRDRRWDNPRIEQEAARDVRYLSKEEVSLLLENVPEPADRNRLINKLLYQTGIRQSELCRIRKNDVVLSERLIRIRESKDMVDTRSVWFRDSLVPPLSEWMTSGRNRFTSSYDSSRLFVSRKKGKMKPGTTSKMIKSAAENAGIQEEVYTDASGDTHHYVTGHILRHSFAVRSLQNGIDLYRLKELMGHSEISTTERYLDAIDEDLREAARRHAPSIEST